MHNYAHENIVYYVMMQYLIRKELKKFKEVGESKVEKEINQLYTKSNFAPMNVVNISKKEI